MATLLEPSGDIVKQTIDSLQKAIDEADKSASVKRIERILDRSDVERFIVGADDLREAIADYRGITREGLTPEDYQEEKETTFEAIKEAMDGLDIDEELLSPLVLERFPYPAPDTMEMGGLEIKIPPARGTPTPPKKPVTTAIEAPMVITMEEYERNWKSEGWELLPIGPTATWRQDWGLWEAIRDIVQNALDESEAYTWGYDEAGFWIADKGKGVSVVNFLLGPPKVKPEYARGRFGEGMKIAGLVLLREGYPVQIKTVGREIWMVFLERVIDGQPSKQLAALYRKGGTEQGTVFRIIGYKGTAFADRFAVNLPKDAILWQGPSLVNYPVQRFNQLISSNIFPETRIVSGGNGRIFARDIYMRDINSPFSYNLWSFTMAPDRHAPADEQQLWNDIGRVWATVNDSSLLETFFKMVKDPPIILSDESNFIQMGNFALGIDPSSGLHYHDIMEDNKEAWSKAWANVMGENAVIRTNPKYDNIIKHLGYQSVSIGWGVKDAIKQFILTDTVIKDISQEKLRETEVIPDEQLDARHKAHLELARALVPSSVSGVYAAIIPPASERVRTAGMYGTSTNSIFISLDILFSGRNTVDTLIHELAHHQQWRLYGEAEDLTPSHAEAMTSVAAEVIERIARGNLDEQLKGIVW